MGKLIITIGRETGSGGRLIGEALASRLNIPCYDKKLLIETARRSGFNEDVIKENEERKPKFFWGAGMYGYEHPLPVQLFMEQSKVIQTLADKESCVIIGRCSDYVLKEEYNLINIFVHASEESRAKRVAEREGIPVDKAKIQNLRTDKARAAYYNYFTGQTWGDSRNYHLTLDSEKLGIGGAVDLIMQYLKIRDLIH